MSADKRIPVTEERHEQLNSLKSAGQTYDELLGVLIESYRKRRLEADMEEKRDGDFKEVDTENW